MLQPRVCFTREQSESPGGGVPGLLEGGESWRVLSGSGFLSWLRTAGKGHVQNKNELLSLFNSELYAQRGA